MVDADTLISEAAAAFIASAAKHLPPSDVWCILYPSLRHLLRSDVRDVDERSLLIALKPPVCRLLLTRPVPPDDPFDSLAGARHL